VWCRAQKTLRVREQFALAASNAAFPNPRVLPSKRSCSRTSLYNWARGELARLLRESDCLWTLFAKVPTFPRPRHPQIAEVTALGLDRRCGLHLPFNFYSGSYPEELRFSISSLLRPAGNVRLEDDLKISFLSRRV
jgi:hypothetical protein